jgi:hypothetical protein
MNDKPKRRKEPPMPGSIHHILVSTATGLVLLGSTAALAEHKDTMITDPDVQRTDARSSDFRGNDLSGGFYDDKYKADDWYYDFYETPSAARRTDERLVDNRSADRRDIDTTVAPSGDLNTAHRIPARNSDVVRSSGSARFVDAARPFDSTRSIDRAAQPSFSRYYDEPWYYEQQREQAYVMPQRTVRDDAYRSNTHSQEMVTGQVNAVKQVRNRTSGGQNTVVHMKAADAKPVIADLGPTQPLLDLALTKGDRITIGGNRENIGPYSVLMANHIKSGSNRVRLDRDAAAYRGDMREVNGRIENFNDVQVRGTAQKNRTAAIRTDEGNLVLVDLGPSAAQNVPANAAPGDIMTARGPVATIGQYPVLLADQFEINNSLPVRVARPGENYPGTSRPWESSHEVIKSQPGATGDGQPRRPSSNSMDGTTR